MSKQDQIKDAADKFTALYAEEITEGMDYTEYLFQWFMQVRQHFPDVAEADLEEIGNLVGK